MRVDTPSADDECVDDGPCDDPLEGVLAAGEVVLANRFGATIKLVEPQRLAGSGPALVARVRVASSPFAMPRTLVIKRYAELAGRSPDAYANEAASYQLFTALTSEDRMCPELIGHDASRRVLVLSDLGGASTLEDRLRIPDARQAERSLLSWARALGRMHATTATREPDFNALLRRLGGRSGCAESEPEDTWERLPALLETALGVHTSETVRTLVAGAAQRVRTAEFRAFSPVDLAPDNNLVTNAGVRFLDFEHGCVRNALIDLAHLRVPFAFWEGALAMPAGMSEAMIAAWRAEVTGVWPALSDDAILTAGLLDSQLRCVWTQTNLTLPSLMAVPDSGPTSRTAALECWWRELAKQAKASGEIEIAEHARSVASALDERFGPGLELALYPAFQRAAPEIRK